LQGEKKRERERERERERDAVGIRETLKRNRVSDLGAMETRTKFSYHYVNHLIHMGFVIIHAIQRKRFVHTKYVISDKLNRKEWSSLYQSIIP
jgi:hypothetical protein